MSEARGSCLGSRRTLVSAAWACVAALGAAGWATPSVAVPVPDVEKLVRDLSNLPWVQYGDGQSYSLPISQLYLKANNVLDPDTGKVVNIRVLIDDANAGVRVANNSENNRTLPLMEKPYVTPTGESSVPDPFIPGNPFFATVPNTYNKCDGSTHFSDGNCPTTQLDNAWDVDLSALKTYLTFDDKIWDPVFYFQNNQIESSGSFNQSLAAWARLWITDPDGAVYMGNNFLFTNNGKPYKLVSEGGGGVFMGDVGAFSSAATDPMSPATPNATDFVLSGGAICVATNSTNPVLFPTPVACGTLPGDLPAELLALGYDTVSDAIPHNLGKNEYAYAVVFPELNALIRSLNWADGYTLHIDVRLGCGEAETYSSPQGDPCIGPDDGYEWGNWMNNGPESIAVGASMYTYRTPEPGTLALLGLGLAGLAASRRRKH